MIKVWKEVTCNIKYNVKHIERDEVSQWDELRITKDWLSEEEGNDAE